MVSRPAPASAALPPMAGEDAPPGFDAFGRAVLEDVRDAVFLQDAEGVLRWANPAAPVLAATFAATGRPQLAPVPAPEVATLPSVVADQFAGHADVTVVSLGPSASAGVTGALLLGRRADPEFGAEQVRAMVEFAKAAGTALANAQRYARQEEATRGLETTLRPVDPPALDGARFETWYE